MIRMKCPGCSSNLTAKDKLAGQTRKCPKCGTPVQIPGPDPAAEADPKGFRGGAEPATLLALDVPSHLERTSHYWICDDEKIVALWRDDGRGWQIKTTAGFVSAKRNRELLPHRGDFKLVELLFDTGSEGVRLRGIMTYQLAKNWALTTLEKGDHEILTMVVGAGSLNRRQKDAIRQAIHDQLMYPVWAEARNVLDYLANTDYHSPGTE